MMRAMYSFNVAAFTLTPWLMPVELVSENSRVVSHDECMSWAVRATPKALLSVRLYCQNDVYGG